MSDKPTKHFTLESGLLVYDRSIFDNITREQALDLAIEKWELIADHAGEVDNFGGRSCALCRLYYRDEEDDTCEGCPVWEKTGRSGCDGTPFEQYLENDKGDESEESKARLRQYALAEVEFLKSLKKAD